jgi:hypothetical protein
MLGIFVIGALVAIVFLLFYAILNILIGSGEQTQREIRMYVLQELRRRRELKPKRSLVDQLKQSGGPVISSWLDYTEVK